MIRRQAGAIKTVSSGNRFEILIILLILSTYKRIKIESIHFQAYYVKNRLLM